MVYCFDISSHNEDLIFKRGPGDDEIYNFGYNYSLMMPVFSWLYHWQVSGENLFYSLPNMSESDVRLDNELEDTLREAIELQGEIPLPTDTFGDSLALLGLANFLGDSNKSSYGWELNEQWYLRLVKNSEDIVLELTPETHREFALDYARFITEGHEFTGLRSQAQEVIRSLQG